MAIEVTKEDRERAEEVLGEMVMGNEERAYTIIARHRVAAYEKGQADARRDKADWLALALL